jgi:GTPase SAR1 family protein
MDYTGYLQAIICIINRSDLKDSEEKILKDLVEKARIRVHDPNCYLAVVGEFSSGKSTLINAFLKDELLPTSALVTTATETRLCYGNSLEVNAFFRQEYKLLMKSPIAQPKINRKNQGSWVQKIFYGFLMILKSFFGITNYKTQESRSRLSAEDYQSKKIITTQDLVAAGVEPRSFINELASDESVAQHVKYIEIKYPSEFLQNGVMIIDLPGINAPNNRHLQLTRTVVEDNADAAIIVIPATQPLTQSLIRFIQINLIEYIDKCIFVITKLDEIKKKDREIVITSVTKRLQDLFHIKNNSVYSCSPELALNAHVNRLGRKEDFESWHDQFRLMEVSFINKLQIGREKAINGSILRLFDHLLWQLDTNLIDRSSEYQSRKSLLEAELLKDFQTFTNKQNQIYQNQINNTISRSKQKMPDLIISQTSYIYDRVKSAIFSTNSWSGLKDTLENRLAFLLNDSRKEINSIIEIQCGLIQEEIYLISEKFDDSFHEAYQRLSVLGGTININKFNNIEVTKINTDSVLKQAKEMNQKNLGNSLKGLFSHLLKGLLEDRQKQVWSLIRPKLECEFKEIEILSTELISNYGEKAIQAIDSRISYYLSVYDDQINSLIQQQEKELIKLQEFQLQTQMDLLQIKELQNIIN